MEGPLPQRYVVKELPTTGYARRTEQNVIDSDGTVIFTHGKLSGGSDLTQKLAIKLDKPWLHVNLSELSNKEVVEEVAAFIGTNDIKVLNVAGKSASKDKEIYDSVYQVNRRLIKFVIELKRYNGDL
jgi:hypothetical protein